MGRVYQVKGGDHTTKVQPLRTSDLLSRRIRRSTGQRQKAVNGFSVVGHVPTCGNACSRARQCGHCLEELRRDRRRRGCCGRPWPVYKLDGLVRGSGGGVRPRRSQADGGQCVGTVTLNVSARITAELQNQGDQFSNSVVLFFSCFASVRLCFLELGPLCCFSLPAVSVKGVSSLRYVLLCSFSAVV